jgi:hypothetical protein
LTACRHCPLKSQCAKANERRIKRWEHEHVLEAVQQRLATKTRWRCAKGARQLSGLDHYAPNRDDTGSTTARSVDEVALIRDTISHYAPCVDRTPGRSRCSKLAERQKKLRDRFQTPSAEAVVFDLVQPASPSGRLGGWARQAGLAEVGEGYATQQHGV